MFRYVYFNSRYYGDTCTSTVFIRTFIILDCDLHVHVLTMMSTVLCRWEDETARERTGNPPSNAEARIRLLCKVENLAVQHDDPTASKS